MNQSSYTAVTYRIFTTLDPTKGLTSYEVRMASRLQEQHVVVHPLNYKVSKFVTIALRRRASYRPCLTVAR